MNSLSQPRRRLAAPLVTLLVCLAGAVGTVRADEAAQQQTFGSARAAIEALVSANKAGNVESLTQILGSGASTLISSGDDTQDRNDRAQFDRLYDQHHRLVKTGPGQLTLLVGSTEWPLPIPLVKKDGRWSFDSDAGAKELLYRRIGTNELAAIEVGRTLYRAQRQYVGMAHDGDAKGVYARRLTSTDGKHDGLYWPVADGDTPSPAGPLISQADVEGYEQGKRQPFHGYYFRILRAQGAHAHGGARDYVVDGRMTGGFAILAYPVEYGASGVMTFLVSSRGAVYEQDLGDATAETVRAMKEFDPAPGWKLLK